MLLMQHQTSKFFEASEMEILCKLINVKSQLSNDGEFEVRKNVLANSMEVNQIASITIIIIKLK